MAWLNSIFVAGAATAAAGLLWSFWPAEEPDRDLTFTFKPTYSRSGQPRILVDDAHLNWHKSGRRLLPFARLAGRDGARVQGVDYEIDTGMLRQTHMLVVANPLGYGGYFDRLLGTRFGGPAFEPHEVEAIRAWVERGGSLLLAVNPGPASAAVAPLAEAFGIRFTNEPLASTVSFNRADGSMAAHPVTEGLERVTAFRAQRVEGLPDSTALFGAGIAMQYGKGRIVALGDATMLTSQEIATPSGPVTAGLHWRGSQNQELALNIVHWMIPPRPERE